MSINLLLTICSQSLPVRRDACCVFLPARAHPDAGGRSAPVWSAHHHRTPEWLLAMAYMAIGWRIGLGSINKSYCGHYARYRKSCCRFCSAGYLCGYGVGADPVYAHCFMTAYLATSPGGLDTVAVIAQGAMPIWRLLWRCKPCACSYFADGASHCAVYFNLCAEAVA